MQSHHFNFAIANQYRPVKNHNQIKQLASEIKTLSAQIKSKHYTTLPVGRPPLAIILIAKQITESQFQQEHIYADNWQAHIVGVLKYAADRLIAHYGNAAQFSRAKAVEQILIAHGMDPSIIDNEHRYTLNSENLHIKNAKWGNYIDEFLDRAEWNSPFGKQITFKKMTSNVNQLIPPLPYKRQKKNGTITFIKIVGYKHALEKIAV